tara:strand:+ start:671 stop:880 length:210 start_codon:yes stop_codon:yes gene_type:complete
MEQKMAKKEEKSTKIAYKMGSNFEQCNTQNNFWGLGPANYKTILEGGTIKIEPSDAKMALNENFIEKAN